MPVDPVALGPCPFTTPPVPTNCSFSRHRRQPIRAAPEPPGGAFLVRQTAEAVGRSPSPSAAGIGSVEGSPPCWRAGAHKVSLNSAACAAIPNLRGARGPAVRLSMHRCGDRCPPRRRWARGGCFVRKGPAEKPPASMPWPGPARLVALRVRRTAAHLHWMAMAPRPATTLALTSAVGQRRLRCR